MPPPTTRPRILIAKPGLDGHDRGAKVVAMGLREAGAEVIYLGLRRTPEQVARAALDEDATVIGLSVLSGAHMALCRKVAEAAAALGLHDVPIVVGGTVPPADAAELRRIGIEVFPTGSDLGQVVARIIELATQDTHDAHQ